MLPRDEGAENPAVQFGYHEVTVDDQARLEHVSASNRSKATLSRVLLTHTGASAFAIDVQ
jgi:hypothetical protein